MADTARRRSVVNKTQNDSRASKECCSKEEQAARYGSKSFHRTLHDEIGKERSNCHAKEVLSLTELTSVVGQWQWQCYCWRMVSFQAMCSTYMLGAMPSTSNVQSASNTNANVPPPPSVQRHINVHEPPRSIEYVIPPVWKRVAAEFIDFLLLFVIKLCITYLLVEAFGISSIKKYDLDFLLEKGELDYKKAMDLTQELVIMEVINRICVSMFETLCLKGSLDNLGGVTPGKWYMRIKVVSCEDVISLGGSRVRLVPGRNIGLANSLVRAVVKNFSMAFFFPICITVFIFQNNRAAYDILSSSIVVEGDIMIRPRDRQ